MKTAERNSRIRWADMFSVCANGTAGRNRRCSSTWGWKQEKLQRWERYFLLTSPSIEQLTLEDVRTRSSNLHGAMKRLSDATDVIYIHVDMDGLDPREVPGHPLTVPGGPTSIELAAALTEMFKYEKVAAFGVASTPYGEKDQTGISRQAAYNLILGAAKGVQQRRPK